ncbi:MAG: hypothetical protein FWF50_04665 [Defluviitaleaceae bacterium]|nr:hypothetical protein [Defluviitaleaceae bacterium]
MIKEELKPENELLEATLKNKFLEVSFINYGARITSIKMPDKNGNIHNIVLTAEETNNFKNIETNLSNNVKENYNAQNLKGWTKDRSFTNAICGPLAGRYLIDGEIILHGGKEALSDVYWELSKHEDSVTFKHKNFKVIYTLKNNELIVSYEAATEFVNLTQHAYFNLSGTGEKIESHILQLPSSAYWELDKNSLPTQLINFDDYTEVKNDYTNENLNKEETSDANHRAWDFRKPRNLSFGIDNPFILEESELILSHPNGRMLTIKTDQPAVVVYTGNNMPEEVRHTAVCLETQYVPNDLEKAKVKKGESYKQETIFKFDILN